MLLCCLARSCACDGLHTTTDVLAPWLLLPWLRRQVTFTLPPELAREGLLYSGRIRLEPRQSSARRLVPVVVPYQVRMHAAMHSMCVRSYLSVACRPQPAATSSSQLLLAARPRRAGLFRRLPRVAPAGAAAAKRGQRAGLAAQ